MRSASRRTLIAGLGATTALALTGASAAPALAAGTATAAMDVYLRATPSWTAVRLLVVPRGAAVSVTGVVSSGWQQVGYAGQTGWIVPDYLTPVAAVAVTDLTSVATYLRSTPSWSGGQLAYLAAGTGVARTGATSGSWAQVTTGGRTGWLHTGCLTPMVERTVAVVARPVTRLNSTFAYGAQSSAYHVWADGIDWSRPTGVLWYLDGDYTNPAWSRVMNPTGAEMTSIAAEANRRNLVCVAVNTPDVYRADVGYTWWYDRPSTAPYFRAFADWFNRTYGMDAGRQWLMGYSGGAQMVTGSIMAQQQSTWGFSGGGAIIVGGGGRPWTYDEVGMGSTYKQMSATWVVGSLDVAGATVPATWSALDSARGGQAYFAAQGFVNTAYTELAQVAHRYVLADVMQAPLDAAGVARLR